MVYKKYIKKNGKFYGPYIYNSRRVNGKVISEYQGTGKKDYKKFVFFILGILILAISIFVIIDSRGKISGNVVANNQISFAPENVMSNNTIIYPVIYFTLISSNSNQKEISNQTSVNEIISNPDKTIINSSNANSNVNVTENNSSTSVQTPATNETNSSSSSSAQISANENQTPASTNTVTSSDNSNVTRSSTSETNTVTTSSETTSATSLETTTNPSASQSTYSGTATSSTATSSDNSAPSQTSTSSTSAETNSQSNSPEQSSITASTTSSETIPASSETTNPSTSQTTSSTATSPSETSSSTPITGNIISGILRTVSNFFLGFLKPTGMAVSEQNINGEINGQVSADKSFTYSLNNGETIQLLSGSVKTDSATLPDDTIKIIYQGNNIIISTNYSENVKLNNSELNVISKPVNFNVEPLNDNEKEILNKEFGNFSVQTTKSELFNGRYIVGYQLGDYNIEYSYDSDLNNETLKSQIENDKTKWLRDIADKLSNTAIVAQNYSLPGINPAND